jgi:hypothetical protein
VDAIMDEQSPSLTMSGAGGLAATLSNKVTSLMQLCSKRTMVICVAQEFIASTMYRRGEHVTFFERHFACVHGR